MTNKTICATGRLRGPQKNLEDGKEVQDDAMLHLVYAFFWGTALHIALFFICFRLQLSSAPCRHMSDRKTHRLIKWLQKKRCCPHVGSISCYISSYATTQPASQPASLLHWFEVNAETLVPTQPAAHLIGLRSPLLSFLLFVVVVFISS